MSSPSIDHYNEALDFLHSGKAPEALAAIVNSLTEDPNDIESWKLYIVVLNTLGRTDDARRAMEKLKQKGLSEADEALMQAAELAGRGDLEAALECYARAVAAAPDRADIHASHALALMECDQADRALEAADRAVACDPGDAHAHYARGRILRLTERNAEALDSLTQAVSLDPDLTLALYEQGMLLAETGRTREALENFRKFLAVHPGDPAATEAVANLERTLGRS